MLQLRIHAPGEVSLDEVDAPAPGPQDVVVRVQACGICGSDLGYVKVGGVAGPAPEPTPLGHEFSGVVDRVGGDVKTVKPGTRVVVNPIASGNAIGNGGGTGAFSPEVLVCNVDRGDVLFPIPESLPDDLAALAEPLGVGMQAVNRANVSSGDKVTIFGAGPIGLMALATLRHRGFEDVAIIDLSKRRLEIAKRLGAALTLDAGEGDVWAPLRELHGTATWLDIVPCTGSDAYIEASGAGHVIGEIISQARPGARISIVALHRAPEPVDFMSVMAKGLTLSGSMAYPEDFSEMVALLGEMDLAPVITHRFSLADAEDAFAVAQDARVSGKVIVTP